MSLARRSGRVGACVVVGGTSVQQSHGRVCAVSPCCVTPATFSRRHIDLQRVTSCLCRSHQRLS
ncbi:putative leader peptide [Protofrankia coriariae]|uniref:putative leader peptide n=1 Tax=Protofrankia TaxID=2994361 RepID=UPI003B84AFF6